MVVPGPSVLGPSSQGRKDVYFRNSFPGPGLTSDSALVLEETCRCLGSCWGQSTL